MRAPSPIRLCATSHGADGHGQTSFGRIRSVGGEIQRLGRNQAPKTDRLTGVAVGAAELTEGLPHRQLATFLWDITYLCWNLTDIVFFVMGISYELESTLSQG